MRAVMAVLARRGAVKLKFPNEDESVLMLISMKDVNLCKFLAPDIPLFNNILSDLFPGVVLPKSDYDHMRASVMKECAEITSSRRRFSWKTLPALRDDPRATRVDARRLLLRS